jgi:hypothetical protein
MKKLLMIVSLAALLALFAVTTAFAEGEGPEEPKGGEGEGSLGTSSAYCGEKKEKNHPVAEGIAETYGASTEEVMGYFCEGYSFGAIMLALQTSGGDVGGMLAKRKAGQGWGQIWKEMGLIGSEKEGHSPPGLLKKPDKETGKPEDTGKPKCTGSPEDRPEDCEDTGKPECTGPPEDRPEDCKDVGKPDDVGSPEE